MDKKLYLNELYDYYGELFTEKQRAYFEAYYFQDLSLAEIAENHDVSRNAVHGQLKIMQEKLEEYEDVLKLYQKRIKMKELLKELNDETLVSKIEELW